MRWTFTLIYVLSVVSDASRDGRTKRHCQHDKQQGMGNERHVLIFPSSVPHLLAPSLCRRSLFSSPWAVRPISGEHMRNKWVLSGTHEGQRYAYQGFSGGLYPMHLHCPEPQLPPLTFSLPPLPLYLPFYQWNVGMQRDQGWREETEGWREGQDKGERMESLGADRPALHSGTFSWAQAD